MELPDTENPLLMVLLEGQAKGPTSAQMSSKTGSLHGVGKRGPLTSPSPCSLATHTLGEARVHRPPTTYTGTGHTVCTQK
jgi:hypothetical protein